MIYRVNYTHRTDGDCGSFFFATKREAERQGVLMRREWRENKKEADEDQEDWKDYSQPEFKLEITEIDVPKGKEEVLLVLNSWARHADNGHPLGLYEIEPLFTEEPV